MAITYNVVDIRGKASEEVIEELLFENKTVSEGYVTFEDDIKAETIFTEAGATAAMQAYTSGVPVSAGSLDAFDVPVTPVKVQFYQEFDPNTLRFSRFKRDMRPGAWEIMSTEFERIVIGGLYARQISLSAERNFWQGATAATQAAVAALTPGAPNTSVSAEEQAMIAAIGADARFDGVLTKLVYNSSNDTLTPAVGGRQKVVGTTITAANIKSEYDKLYEGIPDVVIEVGSPFIYAPYSHKKLITTFNNNVANFKDAFDVSGDSYSFNGIQIVFVPLPENVMICMEKAHVSWCTDLVSDINRMQIDKIANNREDMFLKNNMTIAAHVSNQQFNVLYVG